MDISPELEDCGARFAPVILRETAIKIKQHGGEERPGVGVERVGSVELAEAAQLLPDKTHRFFARVIRRSFTTEQD